MTSYEIETTLTVECVGNYSKGTVSRYSSQFGNWLPGDPPTVENFKVYMVGNGMRIDITSALSEAEIIKLETDFLEVCFEDE